jgi:hypothetical protein
MGLRNVLLCCGAAVYLRNQGFQGSRVQEKKQGWGVAIRDMTLAGFFSHGNKEAGDK